MIISVAIEKAFNKVQHLFLIKKQNFSSRRELSQPNKRQLQKKKKKKCIANIMNGERLNPFFF